MILDMYNDYVADTRDFYDSCTRSDGTFPDAQDQAEYERRVQIQEAVKQELFEE